VRTLVANVLQGRCNVNLLSTFSHAIQDHVDKTVRASATNPITETNVSISVLALLWAPKVFYPCMCLVVTGQCSAPSNYTPIQGLHTHMRARARAHTHAPARTHTHPHAHTRTRTRTRARARAHAHTPAHTPARARTHTHTHTQPPPLRHFPRLAHHLFTNLTTQPTIFIYLHLPPSFGYSSCTT